MTTLVAMTTLITMTTLVAITIVLHESLADEAVFLHTLLELSFYIL